jgi:hypothetical protein
MKNAIKNAVARARAKLVDVWQRQPARVLAATGGAIVFGAAKVGIVLPEASVEHSLELLAFILGLGEAIRTQVTPVAAADTGDNEPADAPGVPAAQ